MLDRKSTPIVVGVAAIVIVATVVSIIVKPSDSGNEKTTEQGGVIIGVGDNNNDNTGELVTGEKTENNTTTEEEETTLPSKDVVESVNSVAGNWATLNGEAFEFVPARNYSAGVYIPSKNIYYRGTYESDDKTYIKINYVDTADSQHTGIIEFKVLSLDKSSSGRVRLQIEDADGTIYTLYPAN